MADEQRIVLNKKTYKQKIVINDDEKKGKTGNGDLGKDITTNSLLDHILIVVQRM